jgi:hypothetical protein
MPKELKTYQQLVQFLNEAQQHRERLSPLWNPDGSRPQSFSRTSLEYKKDEILKQIQKQLTRKSPHLYTNTDLFEAIRYNPNTHRYEYNAERQFDDLSPEITQRILDLKYRFDDMDSHGSTGIEYVQNTLGTHRNILKWLLSWFFPAPKSKTFLDNYGLFQAEQPSGSQPTLGDENSNPNIQMSSLNRPT